MNKEIESRLQRANLEIIGPHAGNGLSVTDAFRRVVHIDVKPVEKIARNSPDVAKRVDETWEAHAREFGVIAEDDSFLAAGSMQHGWLHVRLTTTTSIFATQDSEGELLFVARSLSNNRVCAVSREGGEYWILEEEIP